MEKYINQWVSENMMREYYITFKLLFTDDTIIPSDLSTYTPRNFKKFLWTNFVNRNWASATYNGYRKCLKAYCNYLHQEEYLEDNPLDKVAKRKEPQKLPKALTSEQLSELLSALPMVFNKNTFTGLRNITIVYTFLHTGLRLSELLNLKQDDVMLMDGYLKVVKGKWSKDRVVPINQKLLKILHSHIKKLNKEFHGCEYLFPTMNWNPLQKRDMYKIIKKIRYHITFYFTWHQLRHSFATELVRNNFDIYNISQILGHSKIDTTKIYLSVDVWRLKKQLDSIQLFS